MRSCVGVGGVSSTAYSDAPPIGAVDRIGLAPAPPSDTPEIPSACCDTPSAPCARGLPGCAPCSGANRTGPLAVTLTGRTCWLPARGGGVEPTETAAGPTLLAIPLAAAAAPRSPPAGRAPLALPRRAPSAPINGPVADMSALAPPHDASASYSPPPPVAVRGGEVCRTPPHALCGPTSAPAGVLGTLPVHRPPPAPPGSGGCAPAPTPPTPAPAPLVASAPPCDVERRGGGAAGRCW